MFKIMKSEHITEAGMPSRFVLFIHADFTCVSLISLPCIDWPSRIPSYSTCVVYLIVELDYWCMLYAIGER